MSVHFQWQANSRPHSSLEAQVTQSMCQALGANSFTSTRWPWSSHQIVLCELFDVWKIKHTVAVMHDCRQCQNNNRIHCYNSKKIQTIKFNTHRQIHNTCDETNISLANCSLLQLFPDQILKLFFDSKNIRFMKNCLIKMHLHSKYIAFSTNLLTSKIFMLVCIGKFNTCQYKLHIEYVFIVFIDQHVLTCILCFYFILCVFV